MAGSQEGAAVAAAVGGGDDGGGGGFGVTIDRNPSTQTLFSARASAFKRISPRKNGLIDAEFS
jgi:hypothetical protein